MHVVILYNHDHDLLEDDPGREAREDVTRVAAAIAEALDSQGVQTELLGIGEQPLIELARLERAPPDLVVNLCESLSGDARGEMAVPCLLDLLGIPYTGSSALGLGLALHKHKAKEVLLARGVPTPRFAFVEREEQLVSLKLPFPLIVKPAREDASVGIDFDSVVTHEAALAASVKRVLKQLKQPALVEQFISGREVYVPLLGNAPRRALPLTEIRFGAAFEGKPKIVSYKAKWDAESPEFEDSPAEACELEPLLQARVISVAQAAFESLELRDYGRVDLRISDEGQPYVIEVNPNCDLHPEAGFARSAARSGMDYRDLARALVDTALERHRGATQHGHSPRRSAGPSSTRRSAGTHRNLLSRRGLVRS